MKIQIKIKWKEILFNIGLIICLILINNISTIKNLFFYNKFNLVFANINVIISAILLITIKQLKKYNKIDKNASKMSTVIIFVYNILANLSNSVNILGLLILYFFIIFITYICMTITKLNFEISLVSSVTFLILLFTIAGVLNFLKISIFILLILCLIGIYILIKEKKQIDVNALFNLNGIKIFSILYLIATIAGIGRYVHVWDEYSYWAYAAKVVINTDSLKELCTYVGSMNNYPPASSIWHYIVNIFSGYSESHLYIGLCILEFTYIMPVFMFLKNKKWMTAILLVACACGFPLAFGGSISYTLLYVDLLLGILSASALIMQDYLKNNKKSQIPVYMVLAIMVLLKPSGFIYSGTLLLLFYLKDIFQNKINIRNIFKELKKYIVPGILIVFPYLLWVVYSSIKTDNSTGYFFTLLPDSLKADLAPKLTTSFVTSFFTKVLQSFDNTTIYSFIDVPLFVFLVVVFYAIYCINKKENGIREILPYIISYVVFFVLTVLSLYVMFSYYEASLLASFSRYLAPINMALVLYILYRISDKDILEKFLQYTCIAIILLVGFSNLTFFTDVASRLDTIKTREERINSFSEIINYTDKNSRVFVINQEDKDTIMPLWYARYYCYPRIINASSQAITWKIKTPSNEWDLQDWGLTAESFVKHIIDYNFEYVFLYSSTDELFEELENNFDNVENVKEYKLFKVEKISDNNIKLLPMK